MNDLELLQAIKAVVKLWEEDKSAAKELLIVIGSIITIEKTIKTMPFSSEELILHYYIQGVNN